MSTRKGEDHVVESAALLHNRVGVDAVRWLQDDMMTVVEVEWVDERVHTSAMSAVISGSRRGPSLVDCVGFEIVRTRALTEVFAYDRHFESRGFSLIGQP